MSTKSCWVSRMIARLTTEKREVREDSSSTLNKPQATCITSSCPFIDPMITIKRSRHVLLYVLFSLYTMAVRIEKTYKWARLLAYLTGRIRKCCCRMSTVAVRSPHKSHHSALKVNLRSEFVSCYLVLCNRATICFRFRLFAPQRPCSNSSDR